MNLPTPDGAMPMPTKWKDLYPALRDSLIEKIQDTSDLDKRVHYAHLLLVVEQANHKRTPHECKEIHVDSYPVHPYRNVVRKTRSTKTSIDGGHLEPGGA